MAYSSSVKESELARARAAAYGLIAHGFHYPDGDMLSTLVESRRWENWPDVLRNADRRTSEALQLLQDTVRASGDSSTALHRQPH